MELMTEQEYRRMEDEQEIARVQSGLRLIDRMNRYSLKLALDMDHRCKSNTKRLRSEVRQKFLSNKLESQDLWSFYLMSNRGM